MQVCDDFYEYMCKTKFSCLLVLPFETEREKELSQQLKQATDTTARLQDELRLAKERNQQLLHQLDKIKPVSYTHLTLPTNREV